MKAYKMNLSLYSGKIYELILQAVTDHALALGYVWLHPVFPIGAQWRSNYAPLASHFRYIYFNTNSVISGDYDVDGYSRCASFVDVTAESFLSLTLGDVTEEDQGTRGTRETSGSKEGDKCFCPCCRCKNFKEK